MKRTLLLLSVWGLATALGLAQEASRIVCGTVYTLDNIPCTGVEVIAEKSGAATATDSLGHFSIKCMSKDKLVFKSQVFNKKSVKIRQQTPDSMQVELQFAESPEKLDMAIGYGYIREADRTEAISQMKERNGYCSYHDIYDIFRGKFAGVTVQGTDIIIRGNGSVMASNCALVIVNGVPFTGNLSVISPCDISNISILKDSAAAIYGTRGANGVVVIELYKRQ